VLPELASAAVGRHNSRDLERTLGRDGRPRWELEGTRHDAQLVQRHIDHGRDMVVHSEVVRSHAGPFEADTTAVRVGVAEGHGADGRPWKMEFAPHSKSAVCQAQQTAAARSMEETMQDTTAGDAARVLRHIQVVGLKGVPTVW
jgi:hypothetical protein